MYMSCTCTDSYSYMYVGQSCIVYMCTAVCARSRGLMGVCTNVSTAIAFFPFENIARGTNVTRLQTYRVQYIESHDSKVACTWPCSWATAPVQLYRSLCQSSILFEFLLAPLASPLRSSSTGPVRRPGLRSHIYYKTNRQSGHADCLCFRACVCLVPKTDITHEI